MEEEEFRNDFYDESSEKILGTKNFSKKKLIIIITSIITTVLFLMILIIILYLSSK